MPRRPCTFNRSDIRQAIQVMEALGKKVTAIKLHPDGSFRLMTADHAKTPVVEEKANTWDDLLT
jgi:hypothetical protein